MADPAPSFATGSAHRMDEILAALYRDLALPPTPMHFSTFLSHGGAGLILCTVDRGQVSAMPEPSAISMVRWALAQGPQKGVERGANVPLQGAQADLAHQILADIEAEKQANAPRSGGVWGEALGRLERGEPVNHLDRFKLLMSMLRAGWGDAQVHAAFKHAKNYDMEKTDYYLQHAKKRYM